MTGNTKVWRAPLAGLASVAMIATMGVAASTANAEGTASPLQYPDVNVTLDANGGKFVGSANRGTVKDAKYVDTAQTKLQLSDTQDTNDDSHYAAADGVFPGLYDKYGVDGFVTNNGFVFTGWYTSPDAGGQAVSPSAKLEDGETLYAHWAVDYTDESEEGVTFDLTNGAARVVEPNNPDGTAKVVVPSTLTNTVFVRLADGDQVADWQVPSEDVAGDGFVFAGFDGVESAARGTTLQAKANKGVKVQFKTPAAEGSYDLYKDGSKVEKFPSWVLFDVERDATVADFQAVRNAGKSFVTLNRDWKVYYGTGTEGTTLEHSKKLSTVIPADTSSVTLEPINFQEATQYNVYSYSALEGGKSYFTPSASTFDEAYGQEALDELTRENASAFLGWYNPDDTVSYYVASGSKKTVKNRQFINAANLLKFHDPAGSLWDVASPVKFNFSAAHGQGVVNIWALYDADAAFRTFTVKPLYDQAKSVTVKLYNSNKTIGEQLNAVESQWERSGYSIEGYYTQVVSGKVDSRYKVDESEKVTLTYPYGNTLYVNYTADSKYGKYGLLYNLRRGYKFVKTKHGKIVAQYDVDKDNDGKWDVPATGFKQQLIKPEGFTDASWKDFKDTRDSVKAEIISYLKLAKNSSIETVYDAVAARLSEEKANEFNAAFAGKLAPETDYPDVNYDDYGTHSDDIQYLTTKGIVKGYADGTFGYGAPLARVDYIVWLYRAAGSPAADASAAGFSDVTAKTVPNEEFRKAIAWAKAEGVTTGYADGTFAPYATLNRQDAAAFLYRAAGSPKFQENGVNAKFSDVTAGDTANHSKEVLWAASEGIAKGYYGTVTYFGGYNTLVRQDAAAFLARTLQAGCIK
ncbi:S-layer homology domain-containing protein [Bifidobacterium myosotis]|nr:S-layer homology domain-containing protein [Bifidobacterium myosotis]